MANIATNEVIIVFKEGVSVDEKKDFMKDFNEQFNGEVYNDYSIDVEDIKTNSIELSFGSRWVAPISELEKLADNHRCSIYGIAYEWGCLYVDSYEINPIYV